MHVVFKYLQFTHWTHPRRARINTRASSFYFVICCLPSPYVALTHIFFLFFSSFIPSFFLSFRFLPFFFFLSSQFLVTFLSFHLPFHLPLFIFHYFHHLHLSNSIFLRFLCFHAPLFFLLLSFLPPSFLSFSFFLCFSCFVVCLPSSSLYSFSSPITTCRLFTEIENNSIADPPGISPC